MESSQFTILSDSMVAESSEALQDLGSLSRSTQSMQSTQSFTTQLSDTHYCTCSQDTTDKCKNCLLTMESECAQYHRPDFIELGMKCKCACHLFKNGNIANETACQGCCIDSSDLSSTISEMLSQKQSGRTSRHCSNCSRIQTPPNSTVSSPPGSDGYASEVIILSHSSTPPYPPPSDHWQPGPHPDWFWDWNSRPEACPPKGWPTELPERASRKDILSSIGYPAFVCSHILTLILGIYIGRRLKNL